MGSKSSTKATTIDSLVRVSRVNGRELKSDRLQRDANGRAIDTHGYRLGEHVEALNVSGGLVANGDKWQRALERVRTGHSAGVAVAYVDRLSRDVANGLAWVDALGLAGGVLISGGRVINMGNPHERAGFINELNMGELQLNVYKEKNREVMQDVQRRGITNRVPSGYVRNARADGTLHVPGRDPKMLVLDQTTAPTVRAIFRLRAGGSRWTDVQRWLEQEGIASPTGAPLWTTSSISTLVRNRIYLGEVKMGAHVTIDAHEPLVDPTTFERAQPTSGVVRTGRNIAGVAGGLIVCATCERPLSVSGRGRKGGTFYACRRTSSGGRCAGPVTGDQRSIDVAVDALLRKQAEHEIADVEAVRVQRELSDAREQLAAAEWDRDQFLEGTTGMPAAVIAKGVRRVQAAVNVAAARVVTAEAAATGVAEFPTSGAEWDALSLDDKRDAARSIVERIILAPFPKGAPKKASVAGDRVTVVWR